MPLTVTVLYFAALRDLVQSSSEKLEVQDASSVRDVLSELARIHPSLSLHLARIRTARNEVFVRDDGEKIEDGDVIALIPPVAGG